MLNKNDEMLEIVKCRKCNQSEYYGSMIWDSGHSYCRKCTFERWKSNFKWNPLNTDYTFPLYSDGIDYSKIIK